MKAASLTADAKTGSSHLFEVAGQRWVIGLEWDTATDSASARQRANARARQIGAKYIAYRSPPQPQAGIASPEFSLPLGGAASAAVAIVDARQRETSSAIDMIAAYELPTGGFWVLAIRLDEIIPGGDQYYATEAAARAALEEWVDRLEQSNRAIPIRAPLRWDIVSADPSDLAAELAGARGAPLSARRDWRAYRGYAAVVAAAVVVGVIIYRDYLDQLAEEEAAAKAAVIKPAKPAEPGRPWNQSPLPSSAIQQCHNGLSAAYRPVAGWFIDDLVCVAGQTVKAVYSAKDGGQLRSLDALIDTIDRTITTDGRRVTFSYQSKSASPRDPQTNLLPVIEWQDQLVRNLQREGAAISVAIAATSPSQAQRQQQSGALSGTEIVITAPTNPLRWAHLLDQVPGLVVGSLSVAPSGWTYRLLGTVYDARYYSAWTDQQKSVGGS
jgi:hypothetical protein